MTKNSAMFLVFFFMLLAFDLMYSSDLGLAVIQEQREKDLFLAINQGNLGKLNNLISVGVNTETTDLFGHTPLFNAVAGAKLDCVEVLFNQKKFTAQKKALGRAVFFNVNTEVFDRDDSGTVENSGKKINDTDRCNVLKFLFKKGLGVNDYTDCGCTLVCEAVFLDNPELISFLKENGANVNKKCITGHSALLSAIKGKKLGSVCSLLCAGAKIDPVMIAIVNQEGYATGRLGLLVGKALKSKQFFNAVNKNDKKAARNILSSSRQIGEEATDSEYLYDIPWEKGLTSPILALSLCRFKIIEKSFIQKKFFDVIKKGDMDLFEKFLSTGVDVLIFDEYGRSPLEVALYMAAPNGQYIQNLDSKYAALVQVLVDKEFQQAEKKKLDGLANRIRNGRFFCRGLFLQPSPEILSCSNNCK